jgi:UDP-N-acetylmuramoyl-tripeptide--D-alanyl-D-alanine ligase
VSRILNFGSGAECDARLVGLEETDEGVKVLARILERDVHFRLGAPGAHNASNAVAALLAVAAVDGDVLNAAAALSNFNALKGRGERIDLKIAGKHVRLIDESYNANPSSMAAALGNLGTAQAKRRIAVLGDMLELGADAANLHAGLAGAIEDARADLVFLSGAQMAALWEKIPASRRGAYGAKSADIAEALVNVLQDGDAVLVKGSFGSKMAVIVEALKTRAGD